MALKEGFDFEEKFASTIEMDKIKVILALEIKINHYIFLMISSIESTWEIIHIKNVTKNSGHRGFLNQAGKQTTLMKPLEANCGSNK